MSVVMTLEKVRKVYRMGKEKVVALDSVDLEIQKEKIYCLLGPSGSGKSTLLNMMAGLEPPTEGTIRFGKYKIEKMNENSLANFRRKHIGFVFQSYNLIPTLTALENITMPLLFKGISGKARKQKGMAMLKAIGIGDRWRHKPTEMSGGQQQRVSLGRAFINDPEIIFADEPTGNLDTKTAANMMQLMIGLTKQHHQTLIIVTHNEELSVYADYVVHIRDGNIHSIEENLNKLDPGEMPDWLEEVVDQKQAEISATEVESATEKRSTEEAKTSKEAFNEEQAQAIQKEAPQVEEEKMGVER